MYSSILVIRLSSLGDVLMTIPAVNAIRVKHPSTRISWLVEGSVAKFLSHQSFIDEVITFPRRPLQEALRRGDVRAFGREATLFLKRFRSREYDAVLDFHGILKSAGLSLCARGDHKRIGFGSPFAKEKSHLLYHERVSHADGRIHKVARNLLLSQRVGTNGTIPEVKLTVPESASEYVGRFLKENGIAGSFVAVNPFSSKGTESKRWAMDRYATLSRRLVREMGKTVLVLWGPGEQDDAMALAKEAGQGVFLACSTDVTQLFALLVMAETYVGGDTGVMHLAAFSGTPVVAVFGPTDPLINGPYGSQHRVVHRGLSCSPCKDKGKSCRQRRCLEEITVEEVLGRVGEQGSGVRGQGSGTRS